MYDNLDDAAPPGPPPGSRELVSGRASRLRRRRLLLAGGSGTALLVVVVLVLVSLNGSGSQRATLITATASPSASEGVITPSPTPTPTPSSLPSVGCPTSAACPGSSPSPHLTCPPGARCPSFPPPASPSTTPRATLTTSPCPTNDRGYNDCADGSPGWSTGFTGCSAFEHGNVPSGVTIGVKASLSIPSSGRSGSAVRGTVMFTNENQGTARFTVAFPSDTDAEVGLQSTHGQSASHETSVVQEKAFALAPGESATLPVHVSTTSCGDTSRDVEPPLPTGSYSAWLRLTVSRATVQPSGDPSASPQPVDSGGAWDLQGQITLS